ncbi:MAG TPA: aminoacyl--tRNA ligase-related protein [Patescibacteria group bacterium]|nr:aminoacyl--tRNA ligase-related protein [Patescibacteria group bacterium]
MDSQQFKNFLFKTNILDASYPVKGAHVWLPYGFQFKKLVFNKLETIMSDAGYKQYEFPRLMPGSSLRKIADTVKDFSQNVFWLKDGDKDTDIFLNPTGESGIYPMLQQWIKSPSDLPLRLFQIGSTFRSHHRPYPLINSDESSPLLEGHGVFETRQEVTHEFDSVLKILEDMHNALAIPYRAVDRLQWGNNPVSERNVSFESYFPPKNVNLNIGVAYLQDQIFSRIFDITFEDAGGEKEHTHQLTFGINERALAAMLSIHSDNLGLRLLPEFAPIQVVLIPKPKLHEDHGVEEYAKKIAENLDVRMYIDDNKNRTIKQKINHWRERGVPVLLTIEPDDVQNQTISINRRTQSTWETVSTNDVGEMVSNYFDEVKKQIREDSRVFLEEKIKTAKSYDELVDLVKQNYLVRFAYCGLSECGIKLERNSVGEILGTDLRAGQQGECMGCGKNTTVVGYFSRRAQSP